MSRSGYTDDIDDNWALIRYRGAVASAIRGQRGQAFLKDLVNALDAMPVKELAAHGLQYPDGSVCALGAVGKARGVDMSSTDPEDAFKISWDLNIGKALACEVAFENDDDFGAFGLETPAQRFHRMRRWAASHIADKS